MEGVQHAGRVFELVIDRVLAALERVQRRDLDPVAERLAALVQPVARVEVVSDVLVDAQDLHALESGGIACGLGQDGLDLRSCSMNETTAQTSSRQIQRRLRHRIRTGLPAQAHRSSLSRDQWR